MENHKTERVIFPLTKAELEAIDDWRFATRQPSRAEAIRALIRYALRVYAEPAQTPESAKT